MRALQTHLNRARDLGGRVRVYIPSTYAITWADGSTSRMTKSGWSWNFCVPGHGCACYSRQVDAFEAIVNLGGTWTKEN
jgi:hypothetical protein